MKRIIYSPIGILLLFLASCSSDDRCGEIIDKIIVDDQYKLVIRFSSGATNTNSNNFGGALISDVDVDIDTYNSFEEGDDYCVE
ncbi:MAG: hypothetical protein ISP68_03795 [Flavobacteriaceae bacterium]|nr:hypothetical protein [Flavobacteriaceae bacterium]